jgi:uncharacterized phage protein gp47/JayE
MIFCLHAAIYRLIPMKFIKLDNLLQFNWQNENIYQMIHSYSNGSMDAKSYSGYGNSITNAAAHFENADETDTAFDHL